MTWILLLALVAAVVAIGLVVAERRRSAELRRHFGPEYERALERHGARRAAESDLRGRLERRRNAEVRALPSEARERLCARWRVAQAAFVDDPQASVAAAAGLVEEAMVERGYVREGTDSRDGVVGADAGDVPDRYELVAVDHPALVGRFRAAPRVGADADGIDGAPALSADELRALFLQHHELFEALVGDARTPRSFDVAEARS